MAGQTKKSATTVVWSDTVSIENAQKKKQELLKAFNSSEVILLDISKLEDLDISAVQLILAAEKEAIHLQEMKELKTKIEAQPVKIIVKVAADGHVLGTVTTKHIAEAVEKTIGAKIDKRKITFTALVTCLGDYTAKVQLHKEVTATINIIIATK